ncbi:transposase [Rubinisphaera sp. ICM_H10]|nr:transposase [Rubinisphaera margarita]
MPADRRAGYDNALGRRHVLSCQKRGLKVGKTKSGKGSKVMLLTDAHGLPLGLQVHSASPHDVNLIEPLLRGSLRWVMRARRFIYDTAADSRRLRRRVWLYGPRLIATYRRRRNEQHARRLNSRDQRYYDLRYRIERTFAWLSNYRRLNIRWEYHAHLFEGFWQLACLFTILKRL